MSFSDFSMFVVLCCFRRLVTLFCVGGWPASTLHLFPFPNHFPGLLLLATNHFTQMSWLGGTTVPPSLFKFESHTHTNRISNIVHSTYSIYIYTLTGLYLCMDILMKKLPRIYPEGANSVFSLWGDEGRPPLRQLGQATRVIREEKSVWALIHATSDSMIL